VNVNDPLDFTIELANLEELNFSFSRQWHGTRPDKHIVFLPVVI
jgi:hypothetical protein